MAKTAARIDLWGKGHRVTRGSGEFQRLAPLKRSPTPSVLEALVDRFEHWPMLLDSLHRATPRSLPEQYCVLVTEHHAAVAVPHATRDAHDRASVLVVVAYVEIDWKSHDELVSRICRARSLSVRLGVELAEALAGENPEVSARLRAGTFLPAEGFDLSVERGHDQAFWEELMGGVARFRGIHGVATPRMFAFGANVIVGTRAEAERAGADGFFDQRARQLVSMGERLVTWQPKGAGSSVSTARAPSNSDVVTHVLEMRDKLDRVEATVDRMAATLERVGASEPTESARKMDELRQAVESTNRRVEARLEAIDRRVEQFHRESRTLGEHLLEAVGAMYGVVRRLFP